MGLIRKAVLRDLLLALVVLALAALNYGHQSAVFAASGRVATHASVCGDPLAPAAGEHFACHACRPDIAALPPAPSAVEPVCFTAVPAAFAPTLGFVGALVVPSSVLARAPPTT